MPVNVNVSGFRWLVVAVWQLAVAAMQAAAAHHATPGAPLVQGGRVLLRRSSATHEPHSLCHTSHSRCHQTSKPPKSHLCKVGSNGLLANKCVLVHQVLREVARKRAALTASCRPPRKY